MADSRWGDSSPADVDDARSKLLDAAEKCFIRYGVMKTTVEDVAKTAKVSRATVYRYFGGRDDIILGVVTRDARRFFERLGRRLDAGGALDDIIVDGVLFTVREVRADPHLQLLFAPDAAGVTARLAGASEALLSETTTFLSPYLQTARENGLLREDIDIAAAVEWVLRAVISLLLFEGPRPRTKAQQADFLRTFLVPALVPPGPRKPAGDDRSSRSRSRRTGAVSTRRS